MPKISPTEVDEPVLYFPMQTWFITRTQASSGGGVQPPVPAIVERMQRDGTPPARDIGFPEQRRFLAGTPAERHDDAHLESTAATAIGLYPLI